MYIVYIKNNNVKYLLSGAGVKSNEQFITGQIKLGINTIDSFTFKIFPNNKYYNNIYPLLTLVEIYNSLDNSLIFEGRILKEQPNMDNSGVISKTFICESLLGYFMDSVQTYGEYHNISVVNFLQVIIDNHNSCVSTEKQIIIGNVDVIDPNDSLYRFLPYDKTFPVLKDKLLNRLGGELKLRRVSNGKLYLDYLTEISDNLQIEIRLSKNLKSLQQEKDPTKVITRLYPYGTKLTDQTEQRLDITIVNQGKKYIDDVKAIAEYGIIAGTQMWDDVTLPQTLYNKGVDFLQSNNKILKKHKISALDLSYIGLEIGGFKIGNYYRLINELMNIDEVLRVVEQSIDISTPQNSTLTIGDKFDDIKNHLNNNYTKKTDIITYGDTLTNQINSQIANTYSPKTDVDALNTNLNTLTNQFYNTGTVNIIKNSSAKLDTSHWLTTGTCTLTSYMDVNMLKGLSSGKVFKLNTAGATPVTAYSEGFHLKPNYKYTLTGCYMNSNGANGSIIDVCMSEIDNTNKFDVHSNFTVNIITDKLNSNSKLIRFNVTFMTQSTTLSGFAKITNNGGGDVFYGELMLVEGETGQRWSPMPEELYTGVTTIDNDGVKVTHKDGSYTQLTANGLNRYIVGKPYEYHYLSWQEMHVHTASQYNQYVKYYLPAEFKNTQFTVTTSLENTGNVLDNPICNLWCSPYNIDYVNATVDILAYCRLQNNVYVNIQFSITAIA